MRGSIIVVSKCGNGAVLDGRLTRQLACQDDALQESALRALANLAFDPEQVRVAAPARRLGAVGGAASPTWATCVRARMLEAGGR